MQKSLFRIDKKLHGKTSALNLIYSRMRFCKIVLGVLTYVACDGSLLKRLTLFKFSFQRTVLSVIRQDRKRKKRRARDYFMTAFLCGENCSCDKSRLPFQPEIIQIIARVYFYNDISHLLRHAVR